MNCSAFLPHINRLVLIDTCWKISIIFCLLKWTIHIVHIETRSGKATKLHRKSPLNLMNPTLFLRFDSDMKVWQCWTHSMTVLTLVVLLLVCLTGFYWCLPLHCTSLLWFTHTTSMHLQICIMCNNVVFIFSQLTQKAILLEWERLEWQRLSSHKVITPLIIF